MCVSCVVEDLYESVNDREIRQVFEGQNRIHLEIKQLHRQLAMILDEQRRYVSVITDEMSKPRASTETGQVGSHTHLHMHLYTEQKHKHTSTHYITHVVQMHFMAVFCLSLRPQTQLNVHYLILSYFITFKSLNHALFVSL